MLLSLWVTILISKQAERTTHKFLICFRGKLSLSWLELLLNVVQAKLEHIILGSGAESSHPRF